MPPLFFALFAQLGGDDPELPDLLEVETASIALLARTSSAAAPPNVACRPACGAGHRCLPSDRGMVCVAEVHLGSGVGVERMGRAGQWVIDSGFDVSLVHAWRTSSDSKVTEIRIAPEAGYFFVDHLALHFGLGLQLTLVPNAGTVLGVSGKLGLRYYLDLGPHLGLLPGIDAELAQLQLSARNQTEGRFAFAMSVHAPLLIHIAPPAFFGLGPRFDWFWSNDAGQLNLGLAFLLGFYL